MGYVIPQEWYAWYEDPPDNPLEGLSDQEPMDDDASYQEEGEQ